MRRAVLALAVLAAAVAAFAAAAAEAGEVRVTLTGVESADGTVRAALFADAAAFAAGDPTAGCFVRARPGGIELVFADVAPGTYAISAFHDRNGNGELDANFVGMPREPYGFSNDARGRLGPPAFDAMSFRVGDAPVAFEVRLH